MKTRFISFRAISSVRATPREHVEWARQSFLRKNRDILPKKTSLSGPRTGIFFNFMPSFLPDLNVTGAKIVSRIPGRLPALQAVILVYDANGGQLLAIMDGTFITAARTGAVAAVAVQELAVRDYGRIGIMGLGNCARAALECILAVAGDRPLQIKLLEYKNQAELFQQRFSGYGNVSFAVVGNIRELAADSDIVVSAVTYAENSMSVNTDMFKPGCLLLPIHTRGFEICDASFDKVIVDDIQHVADFRNFDRFRHVAELDQVMKGDNPGRESPDERILAYAIGLSIHDLEFAYRYYQRAMSLDFFGTLELELEVPPDKFWY